MRGFGLAALACLALAGCQASPTPDLWTIAVVPGASVATRPIGIELRRVGLAGYLDRAEIVRGMSGYRLRVGDGDRWGEPLGGMVGRVLTEDLVERLPQASVFVESGAISTRPDVVVEVDIQRFDADADGGLVLLAQIAVRPEGSMARAATIRLVTPVAAGTAQAQVAAMSAALGALADRVARLI